MIVKKRRSFFVVSAPVACTALLVFAVGCASTPPPIGDPYFAKVESKANVYAKQGQAGVLKIAVMPFKASTELIGSSVSDMVVTELLRTQKYSLVERGQMSKVLSETELAMAGLSETKAVEAAKMLGAEAVVIGTVDEYGMQAKGGDTYAVVGLSIRLISCATGKIIWSADLAKIADDDDTPLATHARNVVHELVSGLYQNLTGQAGTLPPSAPSGVNVSEMGLREAVVQWTKPDYPAKYRIERSISQDGPFVAVGEANATDGRFVDSGPALKDSTVYYYRIVGVGKTGTTSDPSEVVETMTAPPPDPPGGVTVRAPSSRCVEVAWTPPRSDGLAKYRIERAVAGSSDWKQIGTAATTTFKDGGVKGCDLADSTVYRYRVIAENRVGAVGAPSQEAEVKTLPPPAVVSGFSAASRGIRCVPISWSASAEGDVEGYEIERAEVGGGFSPIETLKGRGATKFTDGGEEPGDLPDLHKYRYRIRSFNNVGAYSDWSEASATTKPKPTTPSGFSATKDEPGKITLAWAKNPEPDIAEYRVEVQSMGGMFWKSVAKTGECRAVEAGLKPGEERVYRLMAVGPKDHQSEWSVAVQGRARPLPDPPTGLSAVRAEGGFKISFKPPRDGMTAFKVYRKKFLGKDFMKSVKSPEANVEAPPAGETADYVVTAVDECGLESEPSDKVTVQGQ